ncbi:MAG TPA: molybdopterin-dependent oxidoreductase [Chloroflexota bacterium]|nr:molybdopterin-dependent oxidoreductase [Chloroflexota bacterium]
MPRRLTNDLLLALSIALVATGLAGWALPVAQVSPLYDVHRALGVGVLLILVWKQAVVRGSLRWRWGRDGSIRWGILAGVGLLVCLATGLAWTLNVVSFEALWGYSPLNIHTGIGVALLPLVGWHLLHRMSSNFGGGPVLGRRAALRGAGLLLASLVGWQLIERTAALNPTRLATGSKHAGSFSGNRYPTTIWLADSVPKLDLGSWRLRVGGRVDAPAVLSYADLTGYPARQVQAVLDCTSGWWSEQVWTGYRLRDLLQPGAGAREIAVQSVTGHRIVVPLDELEGALLVTHVGGEALTAEHGFPVRLALPGRRGYQWVKWVSRVEVL